MLTMTIMASKGNAKSSKGKNTMSKMTKIMMSATPRMSAEGSMMINTMVRRTLARYAVMYPSMPLICP